MIVQVILQDNPDLIKTWSDEGFYIIQDETGDMYVEAIDPISAGRTYTESEIPIDYDDESVETEELSELEQAARILFGEAE